MPTCTRQQTEGVAARRTGQRILACGLGMTIRLYWLYHVWHLFYRLPLHKTKATLKILFSLHMYSLQCGYHSSVSTSANWIQQWVCRPKPHKNILNADESFMCWILHLDFWMSWSMCKNHMEINGSPMNVHLTSLLCTVYSSRRYIWNISPCSTLSNNFY